MYGTWVIVNLSEDVKCEVWVWCTPHTSDDKLQELAINTLKNIIANREKD